MNAVVTATGDDGLREEVVNVVVGRVVAMLAVVVQKPKTRFYLVASSDRCGRDSPCPADLCCAR